MAPITQLILDVDTGTDDAVALMFAALHPQLRLVATTCVAGNVALPNVVENTLRIFDFIGCHDVPVFAGCEQPLARISLPNDDDPGQTAKIHGDYLDVPQATSTRQLQHAVQFLLDFYDSGAPGCWLNQQRCLRNKNPNISSRQTLNLARPCYGRILTRLWLAVCAGPVAGKDTVLVAVGPLTNLATALKLRPALASQIPRLVIMGGGHGVSNTTPSAEFNFWADPEAASVVMSCGCADITLVPLVTLLYA